MNTRLGALVTHNDDVLAPGAGFPVHPHRDLEIVTWVLSGALQHADSSGGSGVVRPGMVGRLSTGAGVHHSETNASSGETRYLQMWVLPDTEGLPSYETADLSAALESRAFVAVASGSQPAPVTLRCHATFLVARLPAGSSAAIPPAPLLHVYIACGAVTLSADTEQVQLVSEDAARITNAGTVRVQATADAEVLVWTMGAERADA
jgi:redox-sensitive bicupin YhaK (pirin superfamily)